MENQSDGPQLSTPEVELKSSAEQEKKRAILPTGSEHRSEDEKQRDEQVEPPQKRPKVTDGNDTEKKTSVDEEDDEGDNEEGLEDQEVVDDIGKDYLLIYVSYQFHSVPFRVKRNVPMKKLMKAFCERVELEDASARFLFDGRRLRDSDTIESIGIEDDEIIDVLTEQYGGGGGTPDSVH